MHGKKIYEQLGRKVLFDGLLSTTHSLMLSEHEQVNALPEGSTLVLVEGSRRPGAIEGLRKLVLGWRPTGLTIETITFADFVRFQGLSLSSYVSSDWQRLLEAELYRRGLIVEV